MKNLHYGHHEHLIFFKYIATIAPNRSKFVDGQLILNLKVLSSWFLLRFFFLIGPMYSLNTRLDESLRVTSY